MTLLDRNALPPRRLNCGNATGIECSLSEFHPVRKLKMHRRIQFSFILAAQAELPYVIRVKVLQSRLLIHL